VTVNHDMLGSIPRCAANFEGGSMAKMCLLFLLTMTGCATGAREYVCSRVYAPIRIVTTSDENAPRLASLVDTVGRVDYSKRKFVYKCE
jgi:hypothetical protein